MIKNVAIVTYLIYHNIPICSEDGFETFEEQFSNIAIYNNISTRTSENGFESFEEQVLNTAVQSDLIRTVDVLAVGQRFGSWDELNRFISFYTKLQNFVSVIRGSEYSNEICKSHRYVCEHQVRASCSKTTGILKINSVCLNHNNHLITEETNKFALKYQVFSEDMLKNIKFWTETGNINMRTQYQMLTKQYPDAFFLPQDLSNAIQTFKWQNYIECEAAILLNNLLEHKSEDNR
ncbi:25461_t:CDS:2 [Dentiscutata erythropus]|uniref:25461_t:CDS:1 n=1 Tax=Dentiscutata erythropus TaxID=1348616 RepID=A0A9N9NCW2_9GLOM|nr:25461_t:CDS:2 [Dentiscutata erythropus]